MDFMTLDQLPPTEGCFCFLYGSEGVGKTTSCLQSLPLPLAYIGLEGRDVRKPLVEAKRPELYEAGNLLISYYSTHEALMELLCDTSNYQNVASIFCDGFSQLMNIELLLEIGEEIFDSLGGSKDEKDKIKLKKPILTRADIEWKGWEALALAMFRVLMALKVLVSMGKIVVMTALLWPHPRWKKELAVGPALKGKELPANLAGPLDLIALIEHRIKGTCPKCKYQWIIKSGSAEQCSRCRYEKISKTKLFPPLASFESINNEWMAKWSGTRPKNKRGEELNPVVMPLDFRKILRLNEEQKEK